MLMKKANLLYLLIFLLMIGLATPALADAATVSIGPSQQTVSVGQEFNVSVMISDNAINVEAMDFRIDFDPALLQVMDYTAGNFLAQSIVPALSGADETTCLNDANDNGIIGAGLYGSNSSATGTVMTIKFKAKATGNATLQLKSSSLKAFGQNSVAAATVQSGTVNITASSQIIGDFNLDGDVTIKDLNIFVDAWLKTSADPGWSAYDPNVRNSPLNRADTVGNVIEGTYPDIIIAPNGVVNIKDLNVFVYAWKWARTH